MGSRAVTKRSQNWEGLKLNIYRFYIEEGNTLDATMAEFRNTYRLRAKTRKWKQKLKEWGYNKNTKRKRRVADDKATRFLPANARNIAPAIQNFKRRKTIEVSANVATPPSIQCGTLGLENEEYLSENMSERYSPNVSSTSTISKVSRFHTNSTWSLDSKTSNALIPITNMQGLSPVSTLDRYLWEDVQPFSRYELSHQLGDHDTFLVKLRDQLRSITELFGLPDDLGSSPVLCCVDNGFLLGSDATGLVEEVDETNSEVVALEELFGLTVILAEHQQKFGEFAERTLGQEFELAKVSERNHLPKEAEHRCRRILRKYPYTNVQSFLGLLLARSFRLKESSSFLFRALAGFIAESKESSYNNNTSLFGSIELLYTEVILQSELDWASMTSCMCQMMTTIQNSYPEGNPEQLFPQLLIHGFSFAHECEILGMVDSAKDIYKALLEDAPLHLDPIHYGMEMVNAYQRYGALLRIEKKWKLSAEQLQLACESAVKAGLHNSHLTTLLDDDYNHLLPHLAAEPSGEGFVAERLRKALNQIAPQVSLHLSDDERALQVSHTTKDLLSGSRSSPLDSAALFALYYTPGLESFSKAVESVQGDGEYSSTRSTAESHNLKTLSNDQISGISDSYIWPTSAM